VANVAERSAFEIHKISPTSDASFTFEARRTPWWIEGRSVIVGGAVVITELKLSADSFTEHAAPPRVTDDALRALPIGRLRDELGRQLATDVEADHLAEQWGFTVDASQSALRRRLVRALSRTSEGERRRLPDTFYRELALLRLSMARAGITRGVRREMATKLKVTENEIRDWLRTARELGYLAFSGQGSREVEPGERLRVEMREQERAARAAIESGETPWRT
jgi:hypothetical protein